MKWASVANTGKGKTMTVVKIIKDMLDEDPTKEAYCNFHIYHPRAHYTPVMFLPFEKLKNVIICNDDVDEAGELKRFVNVCAKKSRKRHMELFFTCQYYSMIPKKLRRMMDYRLYPNYDKKTDILTYWVLAKSGGYKKEEIKNASKVIGKLYDTDEEAFDPTESDVIKQIAKISTCERDIEKNLMMYTGNRSLRKQLFKEILEIAEFNREERELKAKRAAERAKRKKRRYKRQKAKLIRYIVQNIDLNKSKAYIKGKLLYKTDTFKPKCEIEQSDFDEIITRAIAVYETMRDDEAEMREAIELLKVNEIEEIRERQKKKLEDYLVENIDMTKPKTYIKGRLRLKEEELEGKCEVKDSDLTEIIQKAYCRYIDQNAQKISEEKTDTDVQILGKILYYFTVEGKTKKETCKILDITEGKFNYLYYDKFMENMRQNNSFVF